MDRQRATLYNEHLIRDVGGLFTAIIIVTAWTLWHFGFHVGHLDGCDTVDKLALLASLITLLVLAAIALWTGRNPQPESNGP